jgi:hypothetical protein
MTGWVRVSRAIFEHQLFANEPMSEREAWLWLVAKAAWKDTRHRVGNAVHDVPRGTLFATLRDLQQAWRWQSDYRVRTFLDMLESERMIERTANAGKTHVTICNYSKFQDVERTANAETNEQETHSQRTANALKEQDNKITKEIDTSLRSVERAQKPAPKPRKPSSDDKVFDILTNALSDANARAIIEHRRAKGAKLTERAAELLVKEFFKVHNPDDAAETMIAQGWQGFNVEWYRRARPTGKVIEAGIN